MRIQSHIANSFIEQIDTASLIDHFLVFIQSKGGAAAIWRLPNDNKVQLLADLSGGTSLEDFDLLSLEQGFLLAPFLQSNEKAVHLRSEVLISLQMENEGDAPSLSKPVKVEMQEDLAESFEAFIDRAKKIKLKKRNGNKQGTTKEAYIHAVKEGIKEIQAGKFLKIVPSKVKIIPTDNPISLGRSFLNACKNYKNAFVNLSYTEDSGVWLGASPETLIENTKEGQFKTVALAGTQASSTKAISDIAWTQKEIEEQAYVSRYIIDCFKKIRLREYIEIGPKTIQAGNLFHLKTVFTVNTQEVNFPELASVMLKLLHPTSAVCGMPKAPSLEFLSNYEKHDRAYFSGYLGPVNIEQNTHLFVNLRCCQIFAEEIHFYAGAGITEDSDPEKEWLETEMKCKVLADILAF